MRYVHLSQAQASYIDMYNQGVRSFMLQSRIFVGMVLILIFAEVLGLYGYVRFQSPTKVLALDGHLSESGLPLTPDQIDV